MRGFLLGSVLLIAAYAVLQPGAAAAATAGSNSLVAALQRALSPQVAGVPNRAKGGTPLADPPASPDQGGRGVPIPPLN